MRRKKRKNYPIFIAVGVGILIGMLVGYLLFRPVKTSFPSFIFPQLSTEGFTRVEDVEVRIIGDQGLIALKADCYALEGVVEDVQAQSIQNALERKVGERPNAHDLVKDMFQFLGIKILMVKLTGVRENIYLSKLLVEQENTLLNLDARPSDAIAIALRVNAPIYVNTTLLHTLGKYVC